eukprot:gene11799-13020_t
MASMRATRLNSFCFLILLILLCKVPTNTNSIYGNKTLEIGGIFDYYSTVSNHINPQMGIHFEEAYRFTLDQINNNKSMLHGFKLKPLFTNTKRWERLILSIIQFYTSGTAPSTIGPFQSLDAYRLSILTGSLRYPTVSYGASYDEIEPSGIDFFRTVATDSFRVAAMVELLKRLDWDFVSVISSHAQNGDAMARSFVKKAVTRDICYNTHVSLADKAKRSDYASAVKMAAADPRAKGLLLFTTMRDSINLLRELKEQNMSDRFHIVSATGLTTYVELTRGYETMLDGAISLEVATREIPEFKDHFLALKPQMRNSSEFDLFWENTFDCNIPWKKNRAGFPNNSKRNCTGKEQLADGKGYYPHTPIQPVIDSFYALALAYKYIIETDCSQKAYCDWDQSMGYKYAKRISKYLQANSFADRTLTLTNPITNHDPNLVEYDILNFVKSRRHNGRYENRKIGKWSLRRSGRSRTGKSYLWPSSAKEITLGTITLNKSDVQWRGRARNVTSSCRQRCGVGHVQVRSASLVNLQCCWTCHACKSDQITVNNSCISCGEGSKPDAAFKTKCNAIPRRSFDSDPDSYVAVRIYLILSALGILATIFVASVFIRHNNNRIVRASGRDLCYFILTGIAITFVIPLIYCIEPSTVVCKVRVVIPGIAFCMCYSSLFLKTNRIYRIFRNAQTSVSRPPLISPQSQLIILFFILCGQTLLCVTLIISNKNKVEQYTPETRAYITSYCQNSKGNGMVPVMLNLLLSVVFMVCATWFAFKTRNFPKNYNESKYIGITMYTTCLCWAVFLPSYIISRTNDGSFMMNHLMCVIALCIGFLNLLGLFGQKMKLLLCPACLVDQTMLTTTHQNIQDNIQQPQHGNESYQGTTTEEGRSCRLESLSTAIAGRPNSSK